MRRTWILVGVLLLGVSTLALAHDAVSYGAVRAVSALLGYRTAARTVHISWNVFQAGDLTVTNRAGEPVFAASHVDIAFSLRDLLPGSRRRFGLRAVDLAAPALTLIHHADGSYNVPIPNFANPNAQPDQTPFDLRIRIRDGSVLLVDRYIVPYRERRERIIGMHVDALLSPTKHSYYDAGFDLSDGTHTYPVWGRAIFSAARGFESQHWHADQLPIGPLFDFALSSHALNLADGRLIGLDARVYSIVDRAGKATGLVSASARLKDGKLYAAQLAKPIRDANGPLHLFGDGIETTGLHAMLAGAHLHLVGGIYNARTPSVRFFLDGTGPLSGLRHIAAASEHTAMSGKLAFTLLIEGPLAQPLVLARFRAPAIAYGKLVLAQPDGFVGFRGTQLELLTSSFRYGPLLVEARGSILLEKQLAGTLLARVRGASDELPYIAQFVPAEHLDATVIARGADGRYGASGMLVGAGRGGRLSAPFSVDEQGAGTIGPFSLRRSDGGVIAGSVLLDRPDQVLVASLDARAMHILPGRARALPGFSGSPLPALNGWFDLRGNAVVRESRVAQGTGSVRWYDRHGTLADLSGSASSQGAASGATGHVRASLAALARLGGHVAMTGSVDARFAALHEGTATVLQLSDARLRHARIDGVPIQRADATVVFEKTALAATNAAVNLAGGNVTLQGRFGNGGTLNATAHGLDLAALSASGLSLRKGRLDGVARFGGTARAPTARIGAVLSNAAYANVPLAGQVLLAYAGDRVGIEDASVLAAGAYGTASGAVRGIRGGRMAPRLALDAHARTVDIATLAAALHMRLRYPAEGSMDADVRIAGTAGSPSISGVVSVPEGSLNGLKFLHAQAHVSGSAGDMRAKDGSVTVGSTRVAFAGRAAGATQSVHLRAPLVNLSDFNDFFDAGDMLGGRGFVNLDAARSGKSAHVEGDAKVAHARYRRFALGNMTFGVRTVAGIARAALGITGPRGSVNGTARIALPPGDGVNADVHIAGLDLATWLPAAGITAPLLGKVDAVAGVRGRLHAPLVRLSAALRDGKMGRIAIDRLTVRATADRQRMHVQEAVLEAPSLSATLSGTLGMRPNAPFDLALRARSPNLGTLTALAGGQPVDAAGALDVALHATGTQSRPFVTGQAIAQRVRVRKLIIPTMTASLRADSRMLAIDRAEVDLKKGVLHLAAHVPIVLASHRLAGANAPLDVSLVAAGIDLGQFAAAFPKDTKFGGLLDGHLNAAGTLGQPSLWGHLALTDGSYVSSLVASRVSHVALVLDLFGSKMQLTTLHLESGGGSADGTGVASVGDLRHIERTLALHLSTSAHRLRIDAPRYFRGTVDGPLTLARTPPGPVLVGGNLAFSSTRIPLTALLPPSPTTPSVPSPFEVAFDLGVVAGPDVRVQGANVDLGARGRLHVGGTLASPELTGRLASTGGTISFYRVFAVQSGLLTFAPELGVIPLVDATATTHVSNPDTDVLLHATGPATALHLDFASDPSYSREQIVGLLANVQALGALRGVSSSSTANQPSLVQSTAVGYVDQQFTRALLEPLQSSLGESLGLRNLQLQAGLGGTFGANATASLGRHLTASFAQSYGTTQRQSVGLNAHFNSATSVQLAIFSATGAAQLAAAGLHVDPTQPTDLALLTLIPPAGTSGMTLSYQHHF